MYHIGSLVVINVHEYLSLVVGKALCVISSSASGNGQRKLQGFSVIIVAILYFGTLTCIYM